MRIATVRELKDGERRVGLAPAGVAALVAAGHAVLVEAGAGEGAGLDDHAYAEAGARIVTASEAWGAAELLVKVKEPVATELAFLRADLVLFSFLNLPKDRPLTEALLASRATALAYEHLVTADGARPLLAPMSAISGRMAAEMAVHLLKQPGPGRGKLIGGVVGVAPGRALVVGSGAAGAAAARTLVALGAAVTVIARDTAKLEQLRTELNGEIVVATSTPAALASAILGADVAIMAVLDPGRPAPKLLTREMVRSMGPGAVLIDICIDQGGAAETSRLTTHADPTFIEEGVIHYCVTNMPGAVPRTATLALTAATLPYVAAIASQGLASASQDIDGLAGAMSTHGGRLFRTQVAEAFGMPLSTNRLLGQR